MKKPFLAVALAAMMLLGCCGPQASLFSPDRFQGEVDGKGVSLYTLKNGEIQMQAINFGARIVSLFTPDNEGKLVNIVVGHNNLQDYITPPGERFLGACVGPVANRIGNASFTVDGVVYNTPKATTASPMTLCS